MELRYRQPPTPARTMLDRRDLEDGVVDPLASAFRIVKHPLKELELVLSRAGTLCRPLDNHVFDLCLRSIGTGVPRSGVHNFADSAL